MSPRTGTKPAAAETALLRSILRRSQGGILSEITVSENSIGEELGSDLLGLFGLADDEVVVERRVGDVACAGYDSYNLVVSHESQRNHGEEKNESSPMMNVHPKRIPQIWKPLSR